MADDGLLSPGQIQTNLERAEQQAAAFRSQTPPDVANAEAMDNVAAMWRGRLETLQREDQEQAKREQEIKASPGWNKLGKEVLLSQQLPAPPQPAVFFQKALPAGGPLPVPKGGAPKPGAGLPPSDKAKAAALAPDVKPSAWGKVKTLARDSRVIGTVVVVAGAAAGIALARR